MTQYIQDNLPGMDAELSRIAQMDIDNETTQKHLCNWFIRFGKYQKVCKDPKFQQRCQIARYFAKQGKDFEKVSEQWRFDLCSMMGKQR